MANDQPIASDYTATVKEGGMLSMRPLDALGTENDALRITSVRNAMNGTAWLNGATIDYTHDGSETTTGSFSYTITDGTDTATVTVAVAVSPVNDPPAAVDDRAVVGAGDTLVLDTSVLLENDADAENDPSWVTAVGKPANGSVWLDGTTIIYRHDGSVTTTGGFSYTVTDGTDASRATVVITVTPLADARVADEERGPATPQVAATARPTLGLAPTPTLSPPITSEPGTNAGLVLLIIAVALAIAIGGAMAIAIALAIIVVRNRNKP